MAHTDIKFVKAADLLQDTRELILSGDTGDLLADVTPKKAQAAAGITHDNLLIITGSRGVKDYAFYNLRPMRQLPSNDEISSILTDELGKDAYHRGFLLHASRIKAFLGDRVPSFIIGHSLGAASAQILGTHFNVPTICLASPQVVKRRYLKQDALRSKAHAQWNVFNIAWRKDFVTKGYRMTGLRCLGHRVVVDSKRINFGIDHFVKDYEKLIVSAIDDNAKLPESWPDLEYGLPSRLA